ncbi:MAG: site-specific integrase [Candidatus Gastranaerophilales bacterium]|nr:site-specific integrase [Candidatus Gastranaerophilales bacterium]
MSAKTIHEHHSLIQTILKQAVKELLVPYNAAEKATPPSVTKKEARFIEIDDIQNILLYLENEPLKWQVALNLLIYTGCRRGEIAGIKVENIDFKNCNIYIKNSILYTKNMGIYEDTPKTKNSLRIVSIPEKIMKLVKKLTIENKKNILKLGNKWTNTGYLLTQENGLPMHPDSITDYCSNFEKKYNKIITEKNKSLKQGSKLKKLPHINPHAFRHSQASILIHEGVDITTVNKRLGHANVSTTTDICKWTHEMIFCDR